MRILFAVALFFLCGVASAFDEFPTSGTWELTVQTAPESPDHFPTASVSIETAAGQLACVGMDPAETRNVTVATSATLVPTQVVAMAWSGTGCTGSSSGDSNAATLTLNPPGEPVLSE